MITPFWFSGAGGFQEMVTEVELTGVASASRGGPVGAEEGNREHQAQKQNIDNNSLQIIIPSSDVLTLVALVYGPSSMVTADTA